MSIKATGRKGYLLAFGSHVTRSLRTPEKALRVRWPIYVIDNKHGFERIMKDSCTLSLSLSTTDHKIDPLVYFKSAFYVLPSTETLVFD